MEKIDFYFDFLSPYSYLAFLEISNLFETNLLNPKSFSFKPIPMAMAIKKYVDKGPAEIPPKRDFLFKMALNRAEAQSWPFVCPDILPFDSYPMLRAVQSLDGHENQVKLISFIFNQVWGKGHVVSIEDLEKVLLDQAIDQIDLKHIKENFESRMSAQGLKANLKKALESGVFGVPTFVLKNDSTDGELFWGHDSIYCLRSALNGENWYNHNEYSKFQKLQHGNI